MRDLRLWAGLHILIGLGVPVILVFFFGCKEIEEELPPLQTEVQPEVIETELAKALKGTSVYSVVKNQQAVFEVTQAVESSPPAPYLYMKQDVVEVHDTEEYFSFTFNEIVEDPNAEAGTKPIVRERESPKYVPRSDIDLFSLSERIRTDMARMKLFAEKKYEELADPGGVIKTTYHGLSVAREVQAPPIFVQQRENCSGIPNCELNVTRIQFDQVDWTSQSDYTLIRYSLEITSDAPYLARILSDCLATKVPYEGRKYYIKECQNVLDFWGGTPPTD